MTPIIFGESVIGESHKRHGVEKQDSFLIIDSEHKHNRKNKYYKHISDDVRIVSVADGHGSAACPYSKTGSQTAVNVFCDIMAEYCAKYKEDLSGMFQSFNKEGETSRLAKSIVSEWERRIKEVHKLNGREVPVKDDGSVDNESIWKQYGTTLLGMLITEEYAFTLQLGDGDIIYVDDNTVEPVIEGDKILGVETHSISKPDSWKRVLTTVILLDSIKTQSYMYLLSTDGMANSHSSQDEFYKTCKDYYKLIKEHGIDAVKTNLKRWLSETSELGCGDDITVVIVTKNEGEQI